MKIRKRGEKKRTIAGGESVSSRVEWVFDDKLATRDVTFLYLALKSATENATDKVKFPRRKVDDRETNFITLSKEEKETYLFT